MSAVYISINTKLLNSLCSDFGPKLLRPINGCPLLRSKICAFRGNGLPLMGFGKKFTVLGDERRGKFGVLVRKMKRVVLVRANMGGFGFNSGGGGGGGGGGGNNSNTARILGNLALAVGLTYLSVTGQLGWVLDAIVSIWLVAVLLPIVGLGAFLWWAGREIVQGSCPNCGNDFQIFRSSLNDGAQRCPYCTQPFSVVGDEFVKESAEFTSNQSTTFGQAFGGFSRSSKNGKKSSVSVVDIEAEVKDVD